jgi:hypothetical protein
VKKSSLLADEPLSNIPNLTTTIHRRDLYEKATLTLKKLKNKMARKD